MAKEATDERLRAAHQALREGGDVQFSLPPIQPDPPPPQWLKTLGEWVQWLLSPIGRFIGWVSSLMPDAPYARIFLWTLITVLALLVVWMVWVRVRSGEWRLPRWKRRAMLHTTTQAEPDWAPEHAPAQRWLDQADKLAAEGRYGEAVHHILLRSVEDIGRRRPRLVRPALTSRDIARAGEIPVTPRLLFADLARVVERSLFGGAPVDADDWNRCRAAYAEFALPKAWRA